MCAEHVLGVASARHKRKGGQLHVDVLQVINCPEQSSYHSELVHQLPTLTCSLKSTPLLTTPSTPVTLPRPYSFPHALIRLFLSLPLISPNPSNLSSILLPHNNTLLPNRVTGASPPASAAPNLLMRNKIMPSVMTMKIRIARDMALQMVHAS
jgi:hypothetical protein